ncbi:diacylglycerol kinase family protein [Putridiphycobacter roseus]|uniref:Diacylglycerol kinase family protein n=1 Tax=Putridiphycobacter roseus TaxID=2219161 RepID=A0A2W1NEJ7_9FLAO|nr:diacylglycerol kinase family protein [Putridiphycobacter roseus]PZE17855.1 diacylglycerol kinase family protein [Putridiphycobacter roseus]
MKKFILKELKSFKCAFNGIYLALTEAHIIIQIMATVLVIATGYYQNINKTEWLIIAICIAMVIGAEMMNTAIEKTVDYISMEQHPQAKSIKDISAGAVLVISIVAAIIGINILFL